MTARLSAAVVADIAAVVDLIETNPGEADYRGDHPDRPASASASTSRSCRRSRCRRPRRSRSSTCSTATSAGRSPRQIGKPFWIDTVGRSNLIEIRIQLDDNVLRVFARRSQTYASNSLIFISWMVGTSARAPRHRHPLPPQPDPADPPPRRTPSTISARAAPSPNFPPRGAREVRAATVAFHDMRERVERQIEQRTDDARRRQPRPPHHPHPLPPAARADRGQGRRRGAEEGRRRHEPHARGLPRLRPRRRRRGHRCRPTST